MNQCLRLFCAVGLAISACTVFAAGGTDTYLSYTGTATAQRADNFLYGESHVLHYRDGKLSDRVVLYTCRDGSPFARKTVTYVDPLAPDFALEDASNGMREGVRSAGSVRTIFFRGDGNAAEKTGALRRVPGLVVDAGFDEFVRTHWQPLLDGKKLKMRFLVPSRLEDMGFQVQHMKSDHVDGVPVELFRLELAGVLGWALPGIDVYYSAGEHVLVRYAGISDLRDSSHNNYQAQIVFRPSDRKPVDEQGDSNARRARLAPCK